MSDTKKLRLVLDVEYDAGATSLKWLAENLEAMVNRAVGDGALTGESEAEVDNWQCSVKVVDPEIDVDTWVERLEALGVDDGALDDAVHDVASEIGSTVNNGGLAAQVAFLLTYGDASVIKAAARPAGLESDELEPEIPACLFQLTPEQKSAVSDALSNNEASDDEELEQWFIDQVGVTPAQAKALIEMRPRFQMDPLYELFPAAGA
jgi:hypothetical protein